MRSDESSFFEPIQRQRIIMPEGGDRCDLAPDVIVDLVEPLSGKKAVDFLAAPFVGDLLQPGWDTSVAWALH